MIALAKDMEKGSDEDSEDETDQEEDEEEVEEDKLCDEVNESLFMCILSITSQILNIRPFIGENDDLLIESRYHLVIYIFYLRF